MSGCGMTMPALPDSRKLSLRDSGELFKMTRRELITGSAALGMARGLRRPNLLFILADDHAGYVMGCDGNRMARTPHLDRLASEGTRFAAHYCNSPVCTPSRQSL